MRRPASHLSTRRGLSSDKSRGRSRCFSGLRVAPEGWKLRFATINTRNRAAIAVGGYPKE
jgi:hypothetical protein